MQDKEKPENPFKEKEEEKETTTQEIKEEAPLEEENSKTDEEETTQDETSQEQKEDFEQKYEDLNNKYLRLAADFDNFRKRTTQEKEELSKYTTVQVLKKIAAVLDTFDRAKEHLKDIDNCQTVKDGYEVAYKQFVDTLKKIGMQEIEALGQAFNPNEHEAITQVPTDEYEPDTVAVVAQKGYKLEDRIIRPALVGVAKKKENE